jgi:L-fucose mutarotase
LNSANCLRRRNIIAASIVTLPGFGSKNRFLPASKLPFQHARRCIPAALVDRQDGPSYREFDFSSGPVSILLGISPLIGGSLLSALDLMGHGEILVIADANFPARGRGVTVERLPGINAVDAATALFSLFPVDAAEPVNLMRSPQGQLPVQDELAAVAQTAGGRNIVWLDRHAFEEMGRLAALIVQTGEMRPYANLIVRKGGITART